MTVRNLLRHLVVAIVLASFVAFAWALRQGRIVIEDRWLPWKPLHVADAPNVLTRFKLSRLATDADGCLSVLAEADALRYTPLPDRITGPGCGFTNAVRIEATSAKVGAAFSLSCRAAVSLAMWERHSLQPLAEAHFGQHVARIEHFGSYAYRNVYGREGGRRSQHASADAFDLAGFVLDDGRRVRVLGDWNNDDDAARFLHGIRDGACRFFDAVLSPDYNAAHRDHLHFDRGGYRVCR